MVIRVWHIEQNIKWFCYDFVVSGPLNKNYQYQSFSCLSLLLLLLLWLQICIVSSLLVVWGSFCCCWESSLHFINVTTWRLCSATGGTLGVMKLKMVGLFSTVCICNSSVQTENSQETRMENSSQHSTINPVVTQIRWQNVQNKTSLNVCKDCNQDSFWQE